MFRRRKPSGAPEWAAPLDAQEFDRFRRALDDALAPHGGYELGEGFLTLRERPEQLGLTNLLQQWNLVDPAERPELVRSHFERLIAAFDVKPPTGDALLPLLRPRLWSQEMASGPDMSLLTREVAEDLLAVLCVDLPTSVVNLTAEHAQETGLAVDDLWDLALGQIDDGLEVEQTEIPSGATAFTGESFFVASRLLDLERFAGPIPQPGALVAVPHRHMLLFAPIETVAIVGAMQMTMQLADSAYREGPGSIVPHVFWWRWDAPLLRIPVHVGTTQATVIPPDEFVAMLNTLPAAD